MGKAFLKLALCAAALLPGAALADQGPEKVSFYFAGHEDDWQLFMNPSAFHDVGNPKAKTVFIHMTAGDVGLGLGNGGRRHPLYLARENGADTAIRFMADATGVPAAKTTQVKDFNGHRLTRQAYRNTVSYYLRLPDGGPDGTGYPSTGKQSLQQLATAKVELVSAIDQSATYHGWGDLVGTIRAIVDFERERAPQVQINVPELDAAINPNDHPDHLATAQAALDAARTLPCARRVHYVDYASSRMPENLDGQQRDMESAVFAVTLAGILALDHQVFWHKYDKAFVGRNYFRVEEGRGTCSRPTLELTASAKR